MPAESLPIRGGRSLIEYLLPLAQTDIAVNIVSEE